MSSPWNYRWTSLLGHSVYGDVLLSNITFLISPILWWHITTIPHYPPYTLLFPGLPGWAGTRKVKTNLDFTEAGDCEWHCGSGSGISWAICKSAPRSRQITMPAPYHSVFTSWVPFLPPDQQRQSTEGNTIVLTICYKLLSFLQQLYTVSQKNKTPNSCP